VKEELIFYFFIMKEFRFITLCFHTEDLNFVFYVKKKNVYSLRLGIGDYVQEGGGLRDISGA
jgi:hypothetical protein